MIGKFDGFLDGIQAVIMSFLVKLGPFCVALMPALFTGYSIYHTFKGEASWKLALFFALVVGLAMETVGIIAVHTAVDLHNAASNGIVNPGKFWLMVALVPVYVLGVSLVVLLSRDAFTPLVKGLGVASPWLTCIVYISVALSRDMLKAQAQYEAREREAREREAREAALKAQVEHEAREQERQKELLEIQLRHDEKMAQIEAKKRAITAQETAQKAQFTPPLRTKRKDWRRHALDILRENPHIGGAELGREIGASTRTGQNILKELEQSGTIHKNGNGWVVK